MKIRPRHVLTLILLALCDPSFGQSSTAPFALTLEVENNTVKAGSEVKVDITLRNSSKRAMYMSLGLAEIDYALEVRDSQNRIPPETEFARKAKGRPYFSSDTVFYLQPGESLPKASMVVTKHYDLSRPGKYLIQVSRVAPEELGGGTIKSNPITITVTEAEQKDDETTCQLIEQALRDYEQIKNASTRSEVAKYFVPDGGLQFPGKTRYVYPKCNYIHVDVEFDLVKPAEIAFLPEDKVISVSTLYVTYPAKD